MPLKLCTLMLTCTLYIVNNPLWLKNVFRSIFKSSIKTY